MLYVNGSQMCKCILASLMSKTQTEFHGIKQLENKCHLHQTSLGLQVLKTVSAIGKKLLIVSTYYCYRSGHSASRTAVAAYTIVFQFICLGLLLWPQSKSVLASHLLYRSIWFSVALLVVNQIQSLPISHSQYICVSLCAP